MSTTRFLSIDQFKNEIGASEAKCLRSKESGKLFLACSNGQTYKVQQDIDSSKEMKMLIAEDSTMEDACLINVNSKATVEFTL